MSGTVITIPATRQLFTAAPLNGAKKRRTAAYARVSTDSEEQQASYDAQVDYYTRYIQSRDDWEFVDVYTDEGITGTNTKHREGFKRMVADALDGKIDLILTKSVSRFARNTVDSLVTVRQLRDKGVEIYFEKENIWTLDSKGELLITIMSSLAQEESRSISQNCTWGQRKRFADGKVTVPFGRFLGYDRGPDGSLVLNEEQANVVRHIYSLFLQGLTPNGIARRLTAEGIPTPGGKEQWHVSTVKSILTNEKYKGDALLQKSYTVDFLSKKKKKNEGEIPQYYVTGDHEAIIDPEIFDYVQQDLAGKLEEQRASRGVYAFSGRIICGQCGGTYGTKVWHSNDKYRRVIWQCNDKYNGEQRCTTPHLTDEEIIRYFLQAFNKLLSQRDEIRENYKLIEEDLYGIDALEQQRQQLEAEADLTEELINRGTHGIATTAQNQAEFDRQFEAFCERHDAIKSQLDEVNLEIERRDNGRAHFDLFFTELMKQPEIVDTFDATLWTCMVYKMTVYTKDDIRFTFMDGTEIMI